jgi:hypothetical protein
MVAGRDASLVHGLQLVTRKQISKSLARSLAEIPVVLLYLRVPGRTGTSLTGMIFDMCLMAGVSFWPPALPHTSKQDQKKKKGPRHFSISH